VTIATRSNPKDSPPTGDGRFVASARQHALIIFLLAIIAAQVAWSESRRQEVRELFGYIEKVLKTADAIRSGDYRVSQRITPYSESAAIKNESHLFEVIRFLIKDFTVAEVFFRDPLATLATRSDPFYSCKIRAWIARSYDGVPVSLPSDQNLEESRISVVLSPRKMILVSLNKKCNSFKEYYLPFLVLKINSEKDGVLISVSESFLRQIKIYAETETVSRKYLYFISKAELQSVFVDKAEGIIGRTYLS
jgi:hypothetical protein